MTQTSFTIGTDDLGIPVLPNPIALYDELMGAIEPELVSTVVPTLRQKYQGESPADSKARAARYKKAFKAYDTALKAYKDALSSKTRAYAHAAATSLEQYAKESENLDLQDLESAIDAEPSSAHS